MSSNVGTYDGCSRIMKSDPNKHVGKYDAVSNLYPYFVPLLGLTCGFYIQLRGPFIEQHLPLSTASGSSPSEVLLYVVRGHHSRFLTTPLTRRHSAEMALGARSPTKLSERKQDEVDELRNQMSRGILHSVESTSPLRPHMHQPSIKRAHCLRRQKHQ